MKHCTLYRIVLFLFFALLDCFAADAVAEYRLEIILHDVSFPLVKGLCN